jgi:hypothetical protein
METEHSWVLLPMVNNITAIPSPFLSLNTQLGHKLGGKWVRVHGQREQHVRHRLCSQLPKIKLKDNHSDRHHGILINH